MDKIRTKISVLKIKRKRYSKKNRIDSKTFIIYLDDLKDKESNPLGFGKID